MRGLTLLSGNPGPARHATAGVPPSQSGQNLKKHPKISSEVFHRFFVTLRGEIKGAEAKIAADAARLVFTFFLQNGRVFPLARFPTSSDCRFLADATILKHTRHALDDCI